MALMDEFKAEREKIKHGTFKQKLQHFWYYYKFHTFVCIICLIALSVFMYDVLTKKDITFNATFVNAGIRTKTSTAEFKQLTSDYLNIDTEKYDISIDGSTFIDIENPDAESTYYNIQKLSAMMMTSNVDLTIMNTEVIRSYAYMLAYNDLRDFLTEEQIKKYEPYFYYIDYAVYEEIQAAQEEGILYEKPYPDPQKPEEMKEPIPVGIYVYDAKLLNEYYMLTKDSIIAFPKGSKHPDYALSFLELIFSENVKSN